MKRPCKFSIQIFTQEDGKIYLIVASGKNIKL